jgi:hypothetical protein
LTDYKNSFEVANIGDSAELDRAADKLTANILAAYEACLGGAKGCRSRGVRFEDCKIRKRLIERNLNAP